jgi:tetratricopeptide (TPR) repeat protein
VIRVLACALLLAAAMPARADVETREAHARVLFDQGKEAFDRGEYQSAYDAFKQAYLLSQAPALLYNIATTLHRLERPHDAAETLRAYLRLRPDDPDAAAINARIESLEGAQKLLDAERKAHEEAAAAAAAAAEAQRKREEAMRAAVAPQPPAPAPPPRWTRKKTLAVVIGAVAGALVVGGVIGIGAGLSSRGEPLDRGDIGPVQATR